MPKPLGCNVACLDFLQIPYSYTTSLLCEKCSESLDLAAIMGKGSPQTNRASSRGFTHHHLPFKELTRPLLFDCLFSAGYILGPDVYNDGPLREFLQVEMTLGDAT